MRGELSNLSQLNHRVLKLALFAILLTWALPRNADAQALVQNGDFSVAFGAGALPWVASPVAGLTSVTYTGSSAQFSSFSALSGGVSSLSQTGVTLLDTTHFFDLAFDIAGFTEVIAGAVSFTVTYNGATIFSASPPANGSFSTGIFAITNGTGPLVFTLSSGGLHTLDLDNVVLTDLGVPEIDPKSSAAPLALCFGGIFWVMDRRKRNNPSTSA